MYLHVAEEQDTDAQGRLGGGLTETHKGEAEVHPAGRQLSKTERKGRCKGELLGERREGGGCRHG